KPSRSISWKSTCTPRDAASARALCNATVEMSTPHTSNPRSANQTAFWPSPKATSSARLAGSPFSSWLVSWLTHDLDFGDPPQWSSTERGSEPKTKAAPAYLASHFVRSASAIAGYDRTRMTAFALACLLQVWEPPPPPGSGTPQSLRPEHQGFTMRLELGVGDALIGSSRGMGGTSGVGLGG